MQSATGYLKIRRLVILDARINLTSGISGYTDVLAGLPKPITTTKLSVMNGSNGAYGNGHITTEGVVTGNITGASGNGIVVSGVYISVS